MAPLLFLALSVTITGVVHDVSGSPVPGASLYLRGDTQLSVTGRDGRFQLTSDATGEATLIAVHPGFRATERALHLTSTPVTLDITLEIEPHADHIDVAASADAPPSATPAAKLEALDVYRTPGSDADVMRALQMLPGVSKVDEGAGLYVRGGDVSETATYLDHALLFHPYRYETPTGGFFGSVDPYLISGLTLSTGAFPARYGDALSGVLELTGLDTPPQPSFYANLGLGAASASLSLPLGESAGIRFSGNQSLSRLLFDVNPGSQHFSQLPSGNDLNLSLYAESARAGRFKLSAFADRQQVGVETQQDAFTGILNSSSRNRLVSLDWQRPAATWLLEATASTGRYRDQSSVGALRLASRDSGDRLRFDLSRPRGSWTLRAGAEAERHATTSQGVTPVYGGDLGGIRGIRPLVIDETAWRAGAYAEVEATRGRVTANLGLRADRFQSQHTLTADPRASLLYALPRAHRLHIAWGLYHQAPSPTYLNREYGNPRLPPMRATHLVAGYEYGRESGRFYVRLEAYRKQYRSLPLQSAVSTFNANGYGTARGVDAFVKFAPRSGWQAWASYSYLRSRRLYTPFEDFARYAIPTVPYRPDFDLPHTLQLVLQRSLTPSLSAGASFRIASGKPFTPVAGSFRTPAGYVPLYGPINSDRLPLYQRLDLSLSKTCSLSRKAAMVLYFGVANATNHHNVFAYAYSNDYTQRHAAEGAWERAFYFGATFQR